MTAAPFRKISTHYIIANIVLTAIFSIADPAVAQQSGHQTLKSTQLKVSGLPRYDKYQLAKRNRNRGRSRGRVKNVKWAKNGNCVVFTANGLRQQLNFATGDIEPAKKINAVDSLDLGLPKGHAKRPPVPRAQQRRSEPSPDGSMIAFYKDFNVWIRDRAGTDPTAITTEGSDRLRYGTGCWVYGEELDQDTAMWWSPDSSKLAFYEVDESSMRDYLLTTDNTERYTTSNIVRYPKAGDANPRMRLIVYDVKTQQRLKIPITDQSAEYIFNVRFSPRGDELLFHQSNRQQNRLDLVAADVQTGTTRIILSESQPTWTEPNPEIHVLNDDRTFVWETERTGWKNFELRDFQGKLIHPLSTFSDFPCDKIEAIDENAGWIYYSAFSDTNPYNRQLHRCRLDGSAQIRITSAPLNHSNFLISPDHRWVIATGERFDSPRTTVIYATDKSDARFSHLAKGLALSPPAQLTAASENNELFQFIANDGRTKIYGTLQKPSDFDAAKKYPLLIDVYGGPQSQGINNTFTSTNPICEFGFLIAHIGNRGTINRGKAFESATYKNLGGVDLDDQVAGVKHLAGRPYVDSNRVGIYGHSYGGYLTALALLKRPDVFHVGVAGAPVTDWNNYDTIYTERYMQTPARNPAGYSSASCITYARQLKGKLLLVHGLIDDNVHPANTWQLIETLQRNDQRFDLMVYPKFKHGIQSTYPSLRIEYFYQHLIRR